LTTARIVWTTPSAMSSSITLTTPPVGVVHHGAGLLAAKRQAQKGPP
jgi:hypothetical protein